MYDYIIIGAGSAGCVLAHRLTEDRHTRVLLLEAGAMDTLPTFRTPLAYLTFLRSSYDWAYSTEPQEQLQQRSLALSAGKVLGGSSSINAMIYMRGNRLDYDHWQTLGNTGWSYDELLPYFKRAEHQEAANPAFHGLNGPLHVTEQPLTQLSETFIQAGIELDLPYNPDFNGISQDGVGPLQLTQKSSQRWSAADAYLRPILHRPNLTILSSALATQILFKGSRAIGVSYILHGLLSRVMARHEVLLCAGALHSPRLLLLSGIGPADHLRALDIPVVFDLPGVGQNLQDHLLISYLYKSRSPISMTSAQMMTSAGFVRSRHELPAPDLQLLNMLIPRSLASFQDRQGEVDHFLLSATLLQPQSFGFLCLRANDPMLPPLLQPNYLSHQADQQALLSGMKTLRQFARTHAFSSLLEQELVPGIQVADDEPNMLEYLRLAADSAYHYTGTCKMGLDPQSVVDPQLRVHGLSALRVVDASIMPQSIRGNPHASVIMLAEKAADLLRRKPLSAHTLSNSISRTSV